MGLEIAIYNGQSRDGNKVVNSVKAAYLYADIVRVYDFNIPNGIRRGEKLYDKYLDREKHLQEVEPEVLDKYPWFEHGSEEQLMKLSLEELKWLDDKLNKIILGQRMTIDRLAYIKEFNEIQGCRNRNNEQYTSEKYQRELTRMGIEYLVPEIGVFKLDQAYNNLCSRYFDDKGFKLINDRTFLEKKGLEESSVWTPGYLSEYYISTLPGFEDATMDEIKDIRRELNEHIVPYRSAIIKMAEEIKVLPETESFQQECLSLYLRDIEPKVAAIKAAIDDNNVFKNTAKKIITNKETWVSIGALATAFATTGDIANAVSIGTATALGGLSIAQGVVSTLEEKKKIKDNEMFFLYEIGRRLKK